MPERTKSWLGWSVVVQTANIWRKLALIKIPIVFVILNRSKETDAGLRHNIGSELNVLDPVRHEPYRHRPFWTVKTNAFPRPFRFGSDEPEM